VSTSVATSQFAGAYVADPVHSSFGFAVTYNGASKFRGTLSDVQARLTAGDDGVALEGAAQVESISIVEPAQFRAHLLSADFFHAEEHPEVSFHSKNVVLGDDGSATVVGDLTIRGATREVTATGTYAAPTEGLGGVLRGGLNLETTFDRRDFGLDWQAELPGGGQAVAWDVTLEIQLFLVPAEA
jgi:polyisoprenoid-binding protein YceI